ncbi:hypothetical protein CEUSTIGMA_g310.t1 [Chlamydomonas eustigma]|uniref:HP domain-containing protein n=1 Tax=Chlamydomonas eustigma TaxID=1157962 RepID=A0A250WPS6_9CHLO|nr:hypothetical protein CEUSTIGMA_g310.t1 [Chlamydomonas eustigma]|eukprot:GAX72855.1 hypothetical protein CEUSTIGMA_g310.t1 [Chlamydomonas eustigma]
MNYSQDFSIKKGAALHSCVQEYIEKPHPPLLSLKELCITALHKNINSRNVLELMQVMADLQLPENCDVHMMCLSYMVRTYSILRDRLSSEELQLLLPKETYTRLESRFLEREATLHMQRAVLGRVAERPTPSLDSRIEEASVAGHSQSYTYEALVAGVDWPSDVDPAAREMHMSPTVFERVLGMTYAQYTKLSPWRKMVLKKEFQLF